MKLSPKRRVKRFKRRKKGKTYSYPYIGYSARNESGTPVFVREANLSGLPEEAVDAIDRALREQAEDAVPVKSVGFLGSVPIGANWAGLRIMEDLGITAVLADRLSDPHVNAVLAMVLDRVVEAHPHSKRALAAAFPTSALARIMHAGPIALEQWYRALDKVYLHQADIEATLAAEVTDRVFLYDITSSYFEGTHCPLAEWGYNRDGKKGKKQIVVGLLTNSRGRPLAIKVFPGNTKDETTVIGQMARIKEQLGVKEFVFVGDRGMVTNAIREELDADTERLVDYVTALTRSEILDFIEADDHPLQPGLFDQRNLVEVVHEQKRYVLCHNPEKCSEDRRTRERLLQLTEEKLESVRRNVAAGRYKREKVIAKRLYRWLNRWGMQKCFNVYYGEATFSYERNEDEIAERSSIDGCYVITTTLDAEQMDNNEVVKCYKSLAQVEKAWRMMKTADEFMRPIRHWNPDRVCGHVSVCMLAYLVIWEARNRFAPFLERDESDRTCKGDSLREIWERLDKAVVIGRIAVPGQTLEQIGSIPRFERRLLSAAAASIGKAERQRLRMT